LLLAALVVAPLLGGCLGPAPAAPAAPRAGASLAMADAAAPLVRSLADLADRAVRSVEGSVLTPTADAGPDLTACTPGQGVVGFELNELTPGAPFALVPADPAEVEDDLDILFYRAPIGCNALDPSQFQHLTDNGPDAGFVPPDAVAAIVWLYTGADATFVYREFPPVAPATTTLDVTGAMSFRMVRPSAVSTYFDMYEPHVAVGGSGTIWLAGHTVAADTHHSPVIFSTDDGATWQRPPDPQPLPALTKDLPIVGGRVGQGNEGGIAADEGDRAWLYDGMYVAGTTPLYGWCDDGARSCVHEPLAFDYAQLATGACEGWPLPRALDKPWTRAGHGQVLMAQVGLPLAFVDEFRAVSMLGTYDVASGAKEWNTCIGVGGMPGVPSLRASDGTIAVPQVLRTPEGEGWLVVHSGPSVQAMSTSPPILRAQRSWQFCSFFNGYSDFSAAGTHYVFAGTSPSQFAVSASADLTNYATITVDVPGVLRYMWVEGSKTGEGALITWAVGEDCNPVGFLPATFYAAHVVLENGVPKIVDATVVADELNGTCGHYMGNDVGPDGRAYVVVHASPGGCLGPIPEFAPLVHEPWRVYIQDGGPGL
jgi:hypothetical protein